MIARRTLLALPALLAARPAFAQRRDVPFVPTPYPVVRAMLDLAAAQPGERLIDLGSGDGRIAIAAAERGLAAEGIDIDPALTQVARRRAEDMGVGDRARFRTADLFETRLRDADIVTMYLLPAVNLRLRPRLLNEARPGTRIVSHAFDMGDWRPDARRIVDGARVMLWVVPAAAGGSWLLSEASGRTSALAIEQRYQDVSGTLDGQPIGAATLTGSALAFTAWGRRYSGRVGDAAIAGEGWQAERTA